MKFSGRIGFWEEDVEVAPDVYRPAIKEQRYTGEVLENRRAFQSSTASQNDRFTVTNQISILSDLYLQKNWPSIRYIIWNNAKWKVNSVNVKYPRITLTIGGIWNENEEGTEQNP